MSPVGRWQGQVGRMGLVSFFWFSVLPAGYGVWVQVAMIVPIFQMNKKEALKGVIVLFFKSNFYRFTITPIYHLKFRENPEMAE